MVDKASTTTDVRHMLTCQIKLLIVIAKVIFDAKIRKKCWVAIYTMLNDGRRG